MSDTLALLIGGSILLYTLMFGAASASRAWFSSLSKIREGPEVRNLALAGKIAGKARKRPPIPGPQR
jgi:hypothetical protein